MKKGNRYDTSQLIENQHEEGSHGQVLKNLQGIKDRRAMEQLETQNIEGEKKETYFVAVRAGLDRNYKLMEKIFTDVILRSLKPFEKK